MSEDKELLDVWKKQFEEWAYDYLGDALSKKYLEHAWIAAKRSQQIVVLPKPLICYNKNGQVDEVYTIDQLTAAGIKYTIGE